MNNIIYQDEKAVVLQRKLKLGGRQSTFITDSPITMQVGPKESTNTEEVLNESLANWKTFMALPEMDNASINPATVKGSQLKRALFEFSGACAAKGDRFIFQLAFDEKMGIFHRHLMEK